MGLSTINSDVYVNGNLSSLTATPPAASVATNTIQANAVTAAKLTTTLAEGYINLDLTAARIISANDTETGASTPSGGILANDSAPALKRTNGATDIGLQVLWAAGSVVEIQLPPFAYPPDLDNSQPVVLNLRGEMNGATDTPTMTVKYFENVGGTNKGGTTAAFSNTEQTLTLNITGAAAPPGHANISLTPGAHGTNTLALHAAWITYTRK